MSKRGSGGFARCQGALIEEGTGCRAIVAEAPKPRQSPIRHGSPDGMASRRDNPGGEVFPLSSGARGMS